MKIGLMFPMIGGHIDGINWSCGSDKKIVVDPEDDRGQDPTPLENHKWL